MTTIRQLKFLDRNLQMIWERLNTNWTLDEMAEDYGISKQQIFLSIRVAQRKLRKRFPQIEAHGLVTYGSYTRKFRKDLTPTQLEVLCDCVLQFRNEIDRRIQFRENEKWKTI